MVDINLVRENLDQYKKTLAARQFDVSLVDKVLELDEKRRKLIREIEEIRAERNVVAREKNVEKGKEIKEKLQKLEPELSKLESEYKILSWKLPNVVAEDVPLGKDATENKIIREWGTPRKFDFSPKEHLELGKKLGIIDLDTAVKVTAARFTYLKGDAVLLQNALYQLAIEVLTNESVLKGIADKVKKGYSNKAFVPVMPPLMINPEVYEKMARLSPETEIERYAIPRDNLYLIGSAEHTLGPMHMDETLSEKDFPLRYFAFTAAFRREAGSYGKDTKGILRVHQFDKVEMESFTIPEDGLLEQNFFVGIQEYLMQKLEIPYRVVAICTGDMGGPDFRQIDIEAWLPGQDKYRETHTSDYMTDYQARRLNTKVRVGNGTKIAFMNDATCFAIGRTIIAILENYQQENGSVEIPEALRKWIGKDIIKSQNG